MRNLTYDQIIATVADNLHMSKSLVDRIYRSYWKAVREHISSLSLKEDLTDEEFFQQRANINIPSIGKLYITLEKYRWYKDRFEQIKQLRENKKNAEDNKD